MTQTLRRYDSASFPTIEESIANAVKNPFLIKNFSDSLLMTIDSETVIISEPINILRDFFWMLEDSLVSYVMPEDEFYMPELTSRRLYGTHDLWFICLLANNCVSMKNYKMTYYKVLPAAKINKIEIFLNHVKNTSRFFTSDNSVVYK